MLLAAGIRRKTVTTDGREKNSRKTVGLDTMEHHDVDMERTGLE